MGKTTVGTRMNTTKNELRRRRHNTIQAAVWVIAAALLLVTWLFVDTQIQNAQKRKIQTAEQSLSNLTRVSQEHAYRTFRSADQVMRFVQAAYLKEGNKLDLLALTKQGVINAEIFNQVGIIDAKGIYALANRPITKRLDLSDREHFRVHLEKDTDEMFISKPVVGRATGRWSIQLTRRISQVDGAFAGVVVISIDASYFTDFYKELNLGPEGLNALYGLDGIAKARRVGEKVEFGVDASSAKFISEWQEKPVGNYRQVSVTDGIERLYFYRKVQQYPLIITAGVDLKQLFGEMDTEAMALRIQGASIAVLILLLSAGISYYLVLVNRESTELSRARTEILNHTAKLDAVFDLSPDGFVTFDSNHLVAFTNSAFTAMVGIPTAKLEGMHEHDFVAWLASLCVDGSALTGLERIRQEAKLNTATAFQTIELNLPSRRVLKVELRHSDSEVLSQILYFRDITHESEVEALKSEFLATAAHELRTPMASIFGFVEVLLSQETEPNVRKEFLEIVYRQSKLMIQILNELLDLARIEAQGEKDFVFTRLCLQDVLREVVSSHQSPTNGETPNLIVPEYPIYVTADAGKLSQALHNVVSNAYKYSPDGGEVELRVDSSDVSGHAASVGIHVSDHGIGMTGEQVEKVFTRFYRADTSGKIPGTGLGMSITKEIVDFHKGSISIDSAIGEGTTVSIYLPTGDFT
jgi:signal transduction histidine kinase